MGPRCLDLGKSWKLLSRSHRRGAELFSGAREPEKLSVFSSHQLRDTLHGQAERNSPTTSTFSLDVILIPKSFEVSCLSRYYGRAFIQLSSYYYYYLFSFAFRVDHHLPPSLLLSL